MGVVLAQVLAESRDLGMRLRTAEFLVGGVLADVVERTKASDGRPTQELAPEPRRHVSEVFRYALFDLLAMIDVWIVIGVVLASLLGVFLPDDFFATYAWTEGLGGMLVVLAIALPMYVCTTASVPIAASLIAAGMPLGAALVFLMAGPATNLATLGAVWRGLGGRVLAVYLGTVAVMSLLLGLTFDFVLADAAFRPHVHAHGGGIVDAASALLLVGLLGFLTVRRAHRLWRSKVGQTTTAADLVLEVRGMTCQHCAAHVERALLTVDRVEGARVDLESGRVSVRGSELDPPALVAAVKSAGYRAAVPR